MLKILKNILPDNVKEICKDLAGHNFIGNYYKTKCEKKALISYINKPFLSPRNLTHTNFHEAIAIAEVFRDLGYNVDLVNFTKAKKFDIFYYDVVFGLGEAIEYALLKRNAKKKKPYVIWHGTGSNPFVSNPLTIKQLKYSYEESGCLFMESTRFLHKVYPLSYVFSDLIILYGNEFTRSTYATDTYSPIENINPTTYFEYTPVSKVKDKNNYFWFGSAGAVHKGLDLLINYFASNPGLNLYICGDLQKEADFYQFYANRIAQCANIYYEGFVDISSTRFKELMEIGTFSILPSCSEGIATSVLTTMANGGMIPIVTRNTGVDTHDYGLLIEELSEDGIQKAIAQSQLLSEEEIRRRSEKIIAFSKQNYTIENFSGNLKNILTKYLR